MKPWFPYRSRTRYTASSGINESWIVRCEAIGKTNEDHTYLMANEWIAANLAHFLRLPVPPFSLLRKRSRSTAMFASYSFEGDTTPSDVRPEECFREFPDLCTGILVFDVFIANCDRHCGNVKVDRPGHPRRIYIIDHDHALFYVLPGEGVERLRSLDGRLGITGGSVTGQNRHIFLDVIDTTEHLGKWIDRVGDIRKWFIEDVCEAIVGIGVRRREINEVKRFLIERTQSIGSLISQHRTEFPRISDWPLIL